MNPFAPPDDPNPEAGNAPKPRRSFAERLGSQRLQALLCFLAAAFALFTGRGEHQALRYTVVVLGIACGVQCIRRDAKRRNSPFMARRRR